MNICILSCAFQVTLDTYIFTYLLSYLLTYLLTYLVTHPKYKVILFLATNRGLYVYCVIVVCLFSVWF